MAEDQPPRRPWPLWLKWLIALAVIVLLILGGWAAGQFVCWMTDCLDPSNPWLNNP